MAGTSPQTARTGRLALIGLWVVGVVLAAIVPQIIPRSVPLLAVVLVPLVLLLGRWSLLAALSVPAVADLSLMVVVLRSTTPKIDFLTAALHLSPPLVLLAVIAWLAERWAASERQAAAARLTDPLTELWNTAGVRRRLQEELARAARGNRPLVVGVIDLDHFKPINDAAGHAAGDRCLREVADRLRRGVRAYDVCGRLGGDDFAVVLIDVDTTQAGMIGERLREAIRETPSVDGPGVTASLGLVVWDRAGTAAEAAPSAETLLEAADRLMYAAKQQGRDRVLTERYADPGIGAAKSPGERRG